MPPTGRDKWITMPTEEILAYLKKYRVIKHGSSRRNKKVRFLKEVIAKRNRAYNLITNS